ncbi:hypothetical protein CR513_55545, partial [Mucuna pruriens]
MDHLRGLDVDISTHHEASRRTMLITRDQASSSNEGDENTPQQLLQVVIGLQEKSEEQTPLNAEGVRRHEEAKRCHEEAMRIRRMQRLIGPEEVDIGKIRTRAKKHVEVEKDKEDRLQADKEVPTTIKKANQDPQGKPQYQHGNYYRSDARADHYTPLKTP